MWTQNKLFQPQHPKPNIGMVRKSPHRHNFEHFVVIARSVSGRKYLCERMDYQTLGSVAEDIARGQIYDPLAVLAFNPIEGWARDISNEIAELILDQYGVTRSATDFLEDYLGLGRIRNSPKL